MLLAFGRWCGRSSRHSRVEEASWCERRPRSSSTCSAFLVCETNSLAPHPCRNPRRWRMGDNLVRAQQARQRAEQARLRAIALRDLRLGGRPIGSATNQVEIASANAQDAFEHLIFA